MLHKRIDPTVDALRKKQPEQKPKRILKKDRSTSAPPIGTPGWCLNREALEKFDRLDEEIPVYDDEDIQGEDDDNSNIDAEDDNDDNEDDDLDSENHGKRKKSKKSLKRKSKQKKDKRHKSKKSKRR